MSIPSHASPPQALLDAFPPGALTEIVGPASSGASSLLATVLARTTTAGAQVALVDAAGTFDPASGTASGVDLSKLLWIKCGGRLDATCRAADLLAHCPGFAAIALDLGDPLDGPRRVPRSRWLRLQRAVEGSPTVLIVRSPERLTGSLAALVVSVRRMDARWIGRPRPTRLAGIVSEIRIVRSRAQARGAWRVEWQL